MKTVYKAQNLLVYRVSDEGEIQFRDTTRELGWKRSEFLMLKVQQLGLPAQEVLDEEAAQRDWQPWEEPEEQADADEAKSNAVQLAAILVERQKRHGGEMTAQAFKEGLRTGGCGRSEGFIDYDSKGVSIRPDGEPEMKFTWAKFIKFCKENGLIEENPTAAAGTAPQNAPIASDAQSSPCLSSGADVPTEEGGDDLPADLPEVCRKCKCPTCAAREESCANQCWLNPEWVSNCEYFGPECEICDEYKPEKGTDVCKEIAPKPAAAATTDSPAATPAAETSTTLESEGDAGASTLKPLPPDAPTNLSAPASPADAGAATQSLSAAAPVSLEAQPLASSAFDYTGLDVPTVDALHWAEREICDARRDYVARLAQAVYIAHDALLPVANCDGQRLNNNQHSEKTFIQWCASVGLGKDTAYRLLQVAALLNGSTPEEQAVLEAASPSLLYAAAKPSAPAQLVEGVKSGDITTHKQYQELLAQFKAKEQELADERASREAERASTSALLADEQQRRQEANEARIAAEKAAQGAKESYSIAQKNETLVIRRAKEAEKQLADAQQRIAELEARPVEVVGADPDEIERRAQVLADQKTAQIQVELERVRAEQKTSDSQSDQRAVYDAVILAGRSIEAAWQALAPLLPRLAPEQKSNAIHRFCNQLMIIKEEALETLKTEDNPNADHQN